MALLAVNSLEEVTFLTQEMMTKKKAMNNEIRQTGGQRQMWQQRNFQQRQRSNQQQQQSQQQPQPAPTVASVTPYARWGGEIATVQPQEAQWVRATNETQLEGDRPNLFCGKCRKTGHTLVECENQAFCGICRTTGHTNNQCMAGMQRNFRGMNLQGRGGQVGGQQRMQGYRTMRPAYQSNQWQRPMLNGRYTNGNNYQPRQLMSPQMKPPMNNGQTHAQQTPGENERGEKFTQPTQANGVSDQ